MRFFRARRGKLLKKLFIDIESYKILDTCGSEHFWQDIALEINPSNITLLNVAFSSNDQNSSYKKAVIGRIWPYLIKLKGVFFGSSTSKNK